MSDSINSNRHLLFIKWIHTLIWCFYNVVIFYLLTAVIRNKIDKWVWVSLIFIGVEVLILVIFKSVCPVTLLAKKYSDSKAANFDIFLPNWLAKYNKLIYSIIVAIALCILTFRLINASEK